MTKPKKDGWIRHRGGKCPVDDGAIIDVRLANGDIYKGDKAGDWGWNHEDCMREFRLMAWRPHKQDNGVIAFYGAELIPLLDNPVEPNDALKDVLELDAHESEWKAHDGRKCSAPDRSVVEVLLRNGAVLPAHDCERFTWEHSAVETNLQIMAYRVVDMREPVSYDDDYYYCDCEGPIQWRDRIREIDAASKEEEVRHCAAMEAYDEERTSLVAKLKAEGFVLIQSDEPNGGEESAQPDIAQQDMSDWRNWQKGDKCEVTDPLPTDPFCSGELVELLESGNMAPFCKGSGNDRWAMGAHQLKWHSRPTN